MNKWLVGLKQRVDKSPQVVLSGPYEDSETAEQIGLEHFNPGDYQVISLNTVNSAEATRKIKGLRLKSSCSLSEALERIKHE